jgi:hypothetical protein
MIFDVWCRVPRTRSRFGNAVSSARTIIAFAIKFAKAMRVRRPRHQCIVAFMTLYCELDSVKGSLLA